MSRLVKEDVLGVNRDFLQYELRSFFVQTACVGMSLAHIAFCAAQRAAPWADSHIHGCAWMWKKCEFLCKSQLQCLTLPCPLGSIGPT